MARRLFAFTILALCAFASGNYLPRMAVAPAPEHSLSEILQDMKVALAENPSQRDLSECLAIFGEEQQKSTDKMQEDFSTCYSNAATALLELEKSKVEDREAATEVARSGCSRYTNCNQLENTLDFFNCYKNAHGDSSKEFHTVKSNSDDQIYQIKQREVDIDYEKQKCDVKAQLDFKDETDRIYNNLQECMKANMP